MPRLLAWRILAAVAAAGWLGCVGVVVYGWPSWPDHPPFAQAALWLAVLAGLTALAFALQWRGQAMLSLGPALLAVLLGWMTTWAFGLAWVPGVAALLAAAASGQARRVNVDAAPTG